MNNIKHLFFTLHTYCNFSCKYCWQKHNNIVNAKLAQNRVLNILDYFYEEYFLFYPKNEKIKITFSGGDGLLFIDDLLLYLEKIYQYNQLNMAQTQVVIQTNAYALNNEILQQLKKYNVILQISYDGVAQNITRQNKNKIYNNILLALKNNITVQITSIYTPYTIHLIYQSFLELKNLSIKQWSIGLDFLQKAHQYDKTLLEKQLDLIYQKNDKKLNIKNFEQAQDAQLIINELSESIQGICITPYGEYYPIHFVYKNQTEEHNIFGNDTEGLNYNLYNDFVNNSLNKLYANAYTNNKTFSAKNIVNNLIATI